MHDMAAFRAMLTSLSAEDVALYLRASGWERRESKSPRVAVWTLAAGDEGEFELAQPLDATVSDYALRMAELLQTLEAAESRPSSQVLRDLQTAGADVLYIPLVGVGAPNQLPSLAGYSGLVQSVLDLLISTGEMEAGSSATGLESPAWEMAQFVAGLGVVPSTVGAQELGVASLLPTAFRSSEDGAEPPVPFARRTLQRLAAELDDLKDAASSAAADGTISALRQRSEHQTSAAVLTAVAAIASATARGELELRFCWAPRPTPSVPRARSIAFSRDALNLIAAVCDAGSLPTTSEWLRRGYRSDDGNATVGGVVREASEPLGASADPISPCDARSSPSFWARLVAEAMGRSDPAQADWPTCRMLLGNAAVRRARIEDHVPLVWTIVRRFGHCGVPPEELLQAGIVGLAQAADHYDQRRGVSFDAYALLWIRQSIARSVPLLRHTAAMPMSLSDLLVRLDHATEGLEEASDHSPDPPDLELLANLEGPEAEPSAVGADLPPSGRRDADDAADLSWSAADAALAPARPESDPVASDAEAHLRDVLSILDDLQREIVTRRLGLFGVPEQSLAEVAAAIGLGRKRVQELERQALATLRGLDRGVYAGDLAHRAVHEDTADRTSLSARRTAT